MIEIEIDSQPVLDAFNRMIALGNDNGDGRAYVIVKGGGMLSG